MQERWTPRVTVAAVVERDGRFLMVEEQTSLGLQLNNPAGHLEPGESPPEGAVREVAEETAHHFTPEALVGVYLAPGPQAGRGSISYLRFAYTGSVRELPPPAKLDAGIVRCLWMSLPELRASRHRHRSELVLRCIEDYCAGQRLGLDTVQVVRG
jgi:phosphatase NudJ